MPHHRTDFHLHSTASDGRLTPSALVRALAACGVSWAALTDHDTLAGWEEASAEARSQGVVLECGVELSVDCGGEPVHLLAMGVDPECRGFAEWILSYRSDRQERAERMLERLRSLGVPVDSSRLPDPGRVGVIARPHIADAVVAAGGAVDARDVFDRWLADGAPAFVALPPRPSADAIRRVHDAGGIAVLAHPGDWTAHRTVQTLIREGLDGIEVGHPMHDDVLRAYYQGLADTHGLVVTAGSDFHGRLEVETDRLGAFGLPEPRLALLRERLRAAGRRGR